MRTQREAVFLAVCAVLSQVDFSGPVDLSKDQKKEVADHVFTQFKDGEVAYAGGIPPDDKLRKYIPGLVNNWVRKDTRLNGGTQYRAKNPGSRTGSGDEMLKNMKLLLANTTDQEARNTIQAEIDKRKEQLKPKVEIKVDALPPSLRRLVPGYSEA